ncbi:hypothetical protein [Lactiplantibacillus fabifermentans]|uniref:Uncharacterized protein n=2 Tax=Lactiplantibacillus fabifermentans TaxID=483011 RepID=A0A0R2NME1_9LACO|nr:hypothetical protein [Lactiplantibacillus fabifermentans]ETY74751.1 hypothetical protein LFAB_05665 [Lactiplantibacillus fabifermentans T30PCM01]KRO26905.1 hypothetical protein DY78_GL000470 [Lactiplantibacillus fabifermentans DSM 21115]
MQALNNVRFGAIGMCALAVICTLINWAQLLTCNPIAFTRAGLSAVVIVLLVTSEVLLNKHTEISAEQRHLINKTNAIVLLLSLFTI